ncbi:hypothetical protein N9L68_05360 [bacterium]|nr:hypothetical protein [bacterium]
MDEGCNSCCHGEVWRQSADEKFKKLGVHCVRMDSISANFVGPGEKNSNGRFELPMALKLQDGTIAAGVISSHEMEDSDHPLLLSQIAQAKLGKVKSMRKGAIAFSDYGDRERDSTSSPYGTLHDPHRPHLDTRLHGSHPTLERGAPPDWEADERLRVNTDSEDEHIGQIAVRLDSKRLSRDLQNAKHVIISCGIENFEVTYWSKCVATKFRDHIGVTEARGRGNFDATHVNFDDSETQAICHESLRMNYLELCEGNEIVICNRLNFRDSDKNKEIRYHTGNHANIRDDMATSTYFESVCQPHCELVPHRDPDQKTLTVTACRSGRHRSVAVTILQKNAIGTTYEGSEAVAIHTAPLSMRPLEEDVPGEGRRMRTTRARAVGEEERRRPDSAQEVERDSRDLHSREAQIPIPIRYGRSQTQASG